MGEIIFTHFCDLLVNKPAVCGAKRQVSEKQIRTRNF